MYLQKPFLLASTSLAKFNSIWALTFLTSCLHAWMMSLCPFHIHPCFQPLCASFWFWFWSLARISLFIHTGLLSLRSDSYLLGWTALKIRRDDHWMLTSFLGTLCPSGPYPTGHFQSDLWRCQSQLTWSAVYICFLSSSILWESIHPSMLWSLQLRLPLTFTFLTSPIFVFSSLATQAKWAL